MRRWDVSAWEDQVLAAASVDQLAPEAIHRLVRLMKVTPTKEEHGITSELKIEPVISTEVIQRLLKEVPVLREKLALAYRGGSFDNPDDPYTQELEQRTLKHIQEMVERTIIYLRLGLQADKSGKVIARINPQTEVAEIK